MTESRSKGKIEWLQRGISGLSQDLPANQPRIDWGGGTNNDLPDPQILIGVEDAFDHTPLVAGEKVAFCSHDKVAYHLSTWEFLRHQNHGRCCICGQSNIFKFLKLPGGRFDLEGDGVKPVATSVLHPLDKIIKREDIQKYISLAVVVEDYVHGVYCSKNTGTYFIRFDPRKPGDKPFSGFKVVIFPDYQHEWFMAGIPISNYEGHTLRVRGVIQEHPIWGIEMIVNSPRIIKVVDDSPNKT